MNGNECLVICLFNFIVYKQQVDSQSIITPLLRNLTTGISDLMAQFGNNIDYFNTYILYVGTDICARWDDLGNLLPQLFANYDDCISYNGPFTCYIEMLENHYNDGTLNLEYKDLMYKAEVNYNQLKDKLKFKVKSKVEYLILALNSEIEELKDTATATNTKYVGTVKGSIRICYITNWMNNPPNNGKFYK